MHDSAAWSLNLGRWAGVQVRLHALFPLVGLLTVYLATVAGQADLFWYAWMMLGVILASAVLHELAHCYAAIRVGGRVDEVVLLPWGGLSHFTLPREPQAELFTAAAGPLVNLLIAGISAVALLLMGNDQLLSMLHPLRPTAIVEGPPGMVLLKLTCWINWLIVLVNLLPAPPFDGGRILRAVLRPAFGRRTAIILVSRTARIVAVLLCVVAWLVHDSTAMTPIPAWLPLGLLAIVLLFSAHQEISRMDQGGLDDGPFGYDFSEGYTSLERADEPVESPGFVSQWLERRRESRERRRREIEASEEARVDDILARLHKTGIEGLSPEERALLQRVSARYRSRLEQ